MDEHRLPDHTRSLEELEQEYQQRRKEKIERIRAESPHRVVRLSDFYAPEDMVGEMAEEWVKDEHWQREFIVYEAIPADAARCTNLGGEPIIDGYKARATDKRRKIVADKVRDFDCDRVILRCGAVVVDGHHHLVAAIEIGNSVKYIDLAE